MFLDGSHDRNVRLLKRPFIQVMTSLGVDNRRSLGTTRESRSPALWTKRSTRRRKNYKDLDRTFTVGMWSSERAGCSAENGTFGSRSSTAMSKNSLNGCKHCGNRFVAASVEEEAIVSERIHGSYWGLPGAQAVRSMSDQ